MKFDALTAATMKTDVFLNTPLVLQRNQYFGGTLTTLSSE